MADILVLFDAADIKTGGKKDAFESCTKSEHAVVPSMLRGAEALALVARRVLGNTVESDVKQPPFHALAIRSVFVIVCGKFNA
jgi:hypothetical protein